MHRGVPWGVTLPRVPIIHRITRMPKPVEEKGRGASVRVWIASVLENGRAKQDRMESANLDRHPKRPDKNQRLIRFRLLTP